MKSAKQWPWVLFIATLPSGVLLGLEQQWEEAGGKPHLSCEQVEQALLDLSAEQYAIRDAAAQRLLRAADTRVLTRLMEEAEGGLEAQPRSQAMQLLAQVREKLRSTAFIKDFWMLGPFPMTAEEKQANDKPLDNDCLYIPTGLDLIKTIDLKAQVPLRPDQAPSGPSVKWNRPCKGEKGTLDLCKIYTETPEYAHAFLLTFVYSDRDRPATFYFGSDDGLAIWLNGKCVFYGDYQRPMVVDSDQVTVDLKKGWNPLLLRISQDCIAWLLAFRVADRLGRPWPEAWVDPDCGGKKHPVIPGPVQPADAEKEALIPEALKQKKAQHNLKIQLLGVR